MSDFFPLTILGIDTGSHRIGFGVIRETANQLSPELLDAGLLSDGPLDHKKFSRAFGRLVKNHNVSHLALERIFLRRNLTVGISIAETQGFIKSIAVKTHIPIIQFSPTQVKLQVAGHGQADKKTMQMMIQTIFRLDAPPKPDDVADAIAIALTALWQGSIPVNKIVPNAT